MVHRCRLTHPQNQRFARMQRSRRLDASFLVKKLSPNFYAIPTKMTKSLTDPRTAYEYFLGKRVSDNHWRSLCRTLTENGMTVNDDNVLFYAKVRKQIPRTPAHLKDVLDCYRKAEKFLALNSSKVTGEKILELFAKEDIKPHPATLSRWFKPVGGFRRTRFYYPEKLTPVLASAFIYKLINSPKLGA